MVVFEWTLLLLFGAVLLSGIARRLRVPYPAFLALGGTGLAFLPAVPHFNLDPHLALALFVAPVLLDAAYDTSVRDLKEHWGAVGGLVVGSVLVTTAAVAVVVHLLSPGISWAAAIALGAIVAPPDAAAAAAVLRQVRLPHRLLVILEGESLLNDASSLLIYRAAVAAAVTGTFSATRTIPMFVVVIVGSVIAGWAFARLSALATRRIKEVATAVVTQFLGTFGVWIIAEQLGLSGILTVVVYGIVIARRSPMEVPARLRVPSYAVWETVVFVLNVMAFLLIGLQLKPIWHRLSPNQHVRYVAISLAVLFTVIIARFAWVMPHNAMTRWRIRRNLNRKSRPKFLPNKKTGLLTSWCGMRGIVTLAAALALPDGEHGTAFPFRDLIVLSAFVVVLGTLVLQGFTLRPLLRRLKLRDDEPVAREFNQARAKAIHAAFDALINERSPEADAIRREYEDILRRAADSPDGKIPDRLAGDGIRRKAVAASRRAIGDMRTSGEIGDDAFHMLEERLDFMELNAGGKDNDA